MSCIIVTIYLNDGPSYVIVRVIVLLESFLVVLCL